MDTESHVIWTCCICPPNVLVLKLVHYRRGRGNIRQRKSSCTLNGPFPRGRCTPSPTGWVQSPACPRTELTWGGLALSGCCLMAKHNTDVKENHSASWSLVGFDIINGLLPTLHRPEHGVVVAVADSGGVCETRSPQAGPVPCHLDDGGAPHSSYWGDLPALHGHGTGGEDPAQNRH